MRDRRSVWSDPEVQKLAARFVPAADASDRIQDKACRDADAVLFRKFGGRRTLPSTRAGDGLGQGQYAVAPSGELLASAATADPREVADMLRQALAAWDKLPRDRRLSPTAPDPKAADKWRPWARLYPADGLVLHVVSRDLPRPAGREVPALWRDAWNQDFAWFKKAEARAFLPPDPKPGARHEVPRELVERLARFHLVDNVRALNYAYFPKEAVEKASLTSTVTAADGDRVSVRFAGEVRSVVRGPDGRGYEPKLRGRGTYDLKAGRFTAFELVAVGSRWGAGNCNLRHDDPGPAPMGVVLRLAGDSPAERLPPAFLSKYGWE